MASPATDRYDDMSRAELLAEIKNRKRAAPWRSLAYKALAYSARGAIHDWIKKLRADDVARAKHWQFFFKANMTP